VSANNKWIWAFVVVIVALIGIASLHAMTNETGQGQENMESAFNDTKAAVEESYQDARRSLEDATEELK